MTDTSDEGLLEKIFALVAPPQTTTPGRPRGKRARSGPASSTPASSSTQKHIGIENNPFCNACGDGGSLLCCDNCPASFHFFCCDPPVDPKHLPSGEWLCRTCSNTSKTQPNPPHPPPPLPPPPPPHLFGPLLQRASSANPLIFNIPEELKSTELLPGHSKRKTAVARGGKNEEKDVRPKLCFTCNKRVMATHLAQCDFCPLHFHLSCVDPPLTTPPTTAWICPLHPQHSIPDFEHPRLSRRLKALEKGREEVRGHKVKLDFLSKVSRIPHYKRVTRHLKRRVTQVPAAVKAMYSDPSQDVCETPPLTETLVTAAEVCQWWRGEEERRRREVALLSSSSSSSSSSYPSPHHVDQWTRNAVASQIDHHHHHHHSNKSPPLSPNIHHHSNQGLHDDSAVMLAATQLLELSKRNGVVKYHRQPHQLRNNNISETLEVKVQESNEILKTETVNGFVEEEDLEMLEEERVGVKDDDGGGEREGNDGGGRGSKEEVSVKEEEKMDTQQREEEVQGLSNNLTPCYNAADVSLLNPHLVQLLASQRLQQLFPRGNNEENTTGFPPLKSNLIGKSVNGAVRHVILPTTSNPPPTHDDLNKAVSVLCPVSGIGTAFGVHKHVTLIGAGSGVDVSLSDYGHCNYISPRHACIFYNKFTGEYELLNYSDHGSVVDGVLYSCDFSNKTSSELNPSGSQSPYISVEKAKERLESARNKLRDGTEARRALEGALGLSRHFGKEESGGESSRRTTYNSSVVSIPLVLSRAKKLTAGVPANGRRTSTMTTSTPEKMTTDSSMSLLVSDAPANPCLCRRSASCLVGTDRKGWEGTATLYHGSRLRFGCLQFVFSVSGKPGHAELVDSLSPLLSSGEPT